MVGGLPLKQEMKVQILLPELATVRDTVVDRSAIKTRVHNVNLLQTIGLIVQ